MLRRSAKILLLAALGLALQVTEPVFAQSCFNMQAEMMRLQARGVGADGGGDRDRQRYERAYREQAAVLARTEARARDTGCFGNGFFLFRRGPERVCNGLIAKMREMQDNLDRLDSLRRRGGSRSSNRDDAYRLRELQGMMQARGCEIPGGRSRQIEVETHSDDNQYYERDPYSNSRGTYRTLCVRTCDGYYFPISFSTSTDRLPEDARTCEAMCPGAQVQLYYHDNPGGGPETMVSLAGEPYTALPTAFQYRTSLNEACTCRPGGMTTVAGAPMSVVPAVPVDLTAPLPLPRPARGEDPETLASLAGYLTPSAAAASAPEVTATDAAATGSQAIRVVGPAIGSAKQDALMASPVPN